MIYTVTFNPALDYVVKLEKFRSGEINQIEHENIFVGGKGINVSIVLKRLGISSVALGFVGGFTGEAIESGVKQEGVKTDFVHLSDGISRINVKVKSDDETEINASGPSIPKKALSKLFEKLEELKKGDTLVLAGSIPKTMPSDTYEKILEKLDGKGIRFVVDATKDLLLNVLKYSPFLIKPNDIELGEIFGKTLTTQNEIISCARSLQDRGAKNVLVSMAGNGAILLDETKKIHSISVPDGEVLNSVGAGDSMVAGFIAGFDEGGFERAIIVGTAAGSATAFSEGLADAEKIESLIPVVEKLL